MNTEDYVSFGTAKLLKEKGFDWMESPFYSEQDRDEWRQNNSYTVPNEEYNPELPFDSETLTIVAPHVSLQMAMKWLREKGFHIFAPLEIDYDEDERGTKWYHTPAYCGEIIRIYDGKRMYDDGTLYATPELACEAAIKYCLENLI